MPKKTLKDKHLKVGKAVKWHIYDGQGRLLLKEGMKIYSQAQIDKLINLESFIRVKEDEFKLDKIAINNALSPFHNIDELIYQLDVLFNEIIFKPANLKKKLADKLWAISETIIELCEYDLDAMLGAIHLVKKYQYTTVHPLYCSILCYALASSTGLIDRRVNSLICAALTSNLGMYELQSELLTHSGRLTEKQQTELEKHTMRSAILLRRLEVIDMFWIEIVLQHHEKQDGTGYPRQLKGKEFMREARILGLVDRYHAMVSPRQYRDGMSPTDALKKIFQERGQEVDEELGVSLIKEMGIFPPGAFVKLANEESGIVVRRGKDRTRPIIKATLNPLGQPYNSYKERDSDDKEYRVIGLCKPLEPHEYDLMELWDYKLD